MFLFMMSADWLSLFLIFALLTGIGAAVLYLLRFLFRSVKGRKE